MGERKRGIKNPNSPIVTKHIIKIVERLIKNEYILLNPDSVVYSPGGPPYKYKKFTINSTLPIIPITIDKNNFLLLLSIVWKK